MMTLKSLHRVTLLCSALATLVLLWLAAGVGIIGADGDPANRVYLIVAAIFVVGAALARLKPRGMARVLVTMAVAQIAIGTVAAVTGMGQPHSGPLELLLLNGLFAAAFLAAGALFSHASRGHANF